MLITNEFLKRNVPGFEKCYLVDSASRVGIRNTRRLIGEYELTAHDVTTGVVFPDTITVCPVSHRNVSPQSPHWHILTAVC